MTAPYWQVEYHSTTHPQVTYYNGTDESLARLIFESIVADLRPNETVELKREGKREHRVEKGNG